MDEKNTLGFIKDTQQLFTTIYGDIAQPAVKKVGIALETVFEFSTSIFLPLKFQNEKWKLNFEKRLLDYKEKLNQIPEEDIIEVNPQIGVPIIEKLSYTTNDNIAEMFLNLLIKGSSVKTANIAHPSFISIIERISSDEAKIINYLKHKDYIPYISYKLYQNDSSSYNMILTKATLLPFELELLFFQNVSMYLDNLTSLGILYYDESKYKNDPKAYEELLEKYQYEESQNRLKLVLEGFNNLKIIKSFYELTDYGKSFIQSCVTT